VRGTSVAKGSSSSRDRNKRKVATAAKAIKPKEMAWRVFIGWEHYPECQAWHVLDPSNCPGRPLWEHGSYWRHQPFTHFRGDAEGTQPGRRVEEVAADHQFIGLVRLDECT